ncbi:lysine N(6)-hydroxylase/L-ornithine N(5)-oxygenase family protein [Falsirhodobacter xinxiangensis]|uniref:lysine N(6)-hydroxylase/L-ornithine N(5)-oxygenase family protein n=1 Tax=Falsirhodobacter xinxiangensis TaxID=2530049 RepID=UPI0010AAA5A6|nr:lysine N(6)-hydroxylase/L-ornithine N(5)-oxygenase family protein [Rhodobacter xinxiangensis]
MTDDERIQYKFLIPADLKAALEDRARRSYRSLSAEVILRLRESVRDRELVSDDPLANEQAMIERELAAAEADMQMNRMRHAELQQRLNTVRQMRERSEPRLPQGGLAKALREYSEREDK